MKPPKEGSRKRQVWDALQEGDAAYAIETAASLGLADGTVRSWLGAWGKHVPKSVTHPTGSIDRPVLRPALVIERPRSTKVVVDKSPPGTGGALHERGRVYDIGNKNKVGVIKELGPQVSVVEWPDKMRQNINNAMLRNAKKG